MDEDCCCSECGCTGNCTCGAECLDKEHYCALDQFLVCRCCQQVGAQKNKERWNADKQQTKGASGFTK